MNDNPKLEAFQRLIDNLDQDSTIEAFRSEVEALRQHPLIVPHLDGDALDLTRLSLEDVAELAGNGQTTGYYFLLAATPYSRQTIKDLLKTLSKEAVPSKQRRAHVLTQGLNSSNFTAVAGKAVADRSRTLSRAKSGSFENLFRDYLHEEGVDITMSGEGNVVSVPGLLIRQRKPDGAYPNPRSGQAPLIYLEVKNVKRVSDDIQKRLYEIAQASLEMKTLYGNLELRGMGATLSEASSQTSAYRARMREAITASTPVVVGLLLCSKTQAEPYREGIEAFVDRVFFAREETGECLEFLKATIARFEAKE